MIRVPWFTTQKLRLVYPWVFLDVPGLLLYCLAVRCFFVFDSFWHWNSTSLSTLFLSTRYLLFFLDLLCFWDFPYRLIFVWMFCQPFPKICTWVLHLLSVMHYPVAWVQSLTVWNEPRKKWIFLHCIIYQLCKLELKLHNLMLWQN